MNYRVALFAAVLAMATMAAMVTAAMVTAAMADGIDPGLWKVITRTETGGVIGPPHESLKCLTADQTRDLTTTFTPVPNTVNSVCAPIEHDLAGDKLNWRLTCKGQLDMELIGEFNFDSPHHYSGTVRTKAQMAGMTMVDSQNTIEGQWVSACPQ